MCHVTLRSASAAACACLAFLFSRRRLFLRAVADICGSSEAASPTSCGFATPPPLCNALCRCEVASKTNENTTVSGNVQLFTSRSARTPLSFLGALCDCFSARSFSARTLVRPRNDGGTYAFLLAACCCCCCCLSATLRLSVRRGLCGRSGYTPGRGRMATWNNTGVFSSYWSSAAYDHTLNPLSTCTEQYDTACDGQTHAIRWRASSDVRVSMGAAPL